MHNYLRELLTQTPPASAEATPPSTPGSHDAQRPHDRPHPHAAGLALHSRPQVRLVGLQKAALGAQGAREKEAVEGKGAGRRRHRAPAARSPSTQNPRQIHGHQGEPATPTACTAEGCPSCRLNSPISPHSKTVLRPEAHRVFWVAFIHSRLPSPMPLCAQQRCHGVCLFLSASISGRSSCVSLPGALSVPHTLLQIFLSVCI